MYFIIVYIGFTNNSLENLNGKIKKWMPNGNSLGVFCESCIPSIFLKSTSAYARKVIVEEWSQTQYISGNRIPVAVHTAAQCIYKHSTNYMRIVSEGKLKYYINASASRLKNAAVSAERIAVYCKQFGPNVVLPAYDTSSVTSVDSIKAMINDATDKYQGLHVVTCSSMSNSSLRNISCNCKCFVKNGFICSHSLAVMYLEHILNVEMLIGSIEQPKKAGRPRKNTTALHAGAKKAVKQSKASKKQQKQFISMTLA